MVKNMDNLIFIGAFVLVWIVAGCILMPAMYLGEYLGKRSAKKQDKKQAKKSSTFLLAKFI